MVSTRSRAASSESGPLAGYTFILYGNQPRGYTHDSIKKGILEYGGNVIDNVKAIHTVEGNTYLLCTRQVFERGPVKANHAERLRCPIVNSLEWLMGENWDPHGLSSCYLWSPGQLKSALRLTSAKRSVANDEHGSHTGEDAQLGAQQTTACNRLTVRFKDDKEPRQTPPVSISSQVTRSLTALVLNINESSLKQLSCENIEQGLKYLRGMGNNLNEASKKSLTYHTVISDRSSDTVRIINCQKAVKKEETWLREVPAIIEAIEELTPLSKASVEFKYLEGYFKASSGTVQELDFEVENIFRVGRPDERKRFQEYNDHQKAPLRRLLWHGSPLRDYCRILTEGLEVAPVEVPGLGHNFGDGIHLFETSLQAARYCDHGEHNGEALLLVCETALVFPFNKVTKASNSNADDTTMDTTRCEGKVAFLRLVDGGGIHETLKGVKVPGSAFELKPTKVVEEALLECPEYICRNVDQVDPRYLLQLKMREPE